MDFVRRMHKQSNIEKEYEIESNDSDAEQKEYSKSKPTSSSNKRTQNTVDGKYKKLKISNSSARSRELDNSVLDRFNKRNNSSMNLLQDSFVCLDDTQCLIDKSDNSSTWKSSGSELIDDSSSDKLERNLSGENVVTSAIWSQDTQTFIKNVTKNNVGENLRISQFSFFRPDTQQLNEIGDSISQNNKKCIPEDNGSIEINRKAENKIKNESIGQSFTKEPEAFKEEYRNEVHKLFEKVELSIYEFGTSKQDNSFGGDIFEQIPTTRNNSFLKSLVEVINNENNKESDALVTEAELTSALLNMSTTQETTFGDLIKKALLENARKSATDPANLLNTTVEDSNSEFKNLGNFYGLPNKVLELIKVFKGIDKLYDWQDECLKLPAVNERKNLVYALPTSGGKTLVAEILMFREILCRQHNVLFVLPYVAIVQEKVWALSPFAVNLNFLIEEYAAGKGNYPPRKRRRKNSIYVATIEKALGIIDSLIEQKRLNEIGLVVVDELHLIGDQSRGSTLEAFLTKLVVLNENVQIIGMSATIGNIEDICKFLNAEFYIKNFRPVELIEYVKCGNEIAKINWNVKSREDLLSFHRKINFSYSESLIRIDPDCLGGLVLEVIPDGSCLIFCSTKKNCENVAFLLCKVIYPKLKEYKKKEKNDLMRVLEEQTGNICNILSVSIPFGVAYHHSGLTAEERKLIEEAFRSGIISVICCTSTLAAGVNLPAKRVILRQPYIGKSFINLSRYKQMVGRAGRTGLGETGESILICTKNELPKVQELLMSPMDFSMSSMHEFDGKGLRHLLLSCISLNIAVTRPELHKIVSKTLLAIQQEKLNINVKKLTDSVIIFLFKLGALETSENSYQNTGDNFHDLSVINVSNPLPTPNSDSESNKTDQKSKVRVIINNDSKLIISKLGAAAIKGGLDLMRAHILYDDLLKAQSSLVLIDCLHLMYLVTPYDISEQVKPTLSHYYTIFTQLGTKELQTAKILGLTESCAIRMISNLPIKSVSERVLYRFYVTLMLYDLWNEKTVYEVSEKYQVNRGLIQNLMTAAATFSSNVVCFCEELEEFWAFAHLLRGMSQRLSHCCIKDLAMLMELPAVKQNRAKQLFNAGYKNLQSIAKANPKELIEKIEFMSFTIANQLIAAAKLLLLEKIENLREEAEDVMDGIDDKKKV